MAQRLADWHRERLAAAKLLQKRDTLAELWAQHQAQPGIERMQLMSKLLHDYANAPSIASIELFDSGLQSLWHSASSASPSHPSLSAGLQAVRAQEQAQVVGPWRDAQGRVQLAYVGLLKPQGHAPALVALHAQRPPYFHPALTQWPLEQRTGSAQLFSIRAQQVHYWSDLPSASPSLRALDPTQTFAQRLLRGEIGTGTLVHGPDDLGNRALAVLLPVDGTDWVLQIEADHAELMGQAQRSLISLGLLGTLALLLALGGTRLLLQRRQLESAQQALAALERAQTRLSESEARYRLLAENANDVVWLYDIASDRLLYVSPSVQRLLGYRPEQREQLSLDDLYEPNTLALLRGLLRDQLQRFLAGDQQAQVLVREFDLWHRDNGSPVAVEISAQFLLDAQGQPVQIQGVTRDIRERRRAEQQIRLLSQATEQSPAMVIITDAAGAIQYVNPAFERISGYAAAEVLGHNPRLIKSSRTPSETHRQMWQALRAGQVWQGEFINTNKDGSHCHLSATIAPLRDAQGGVEHYVALEMDVTAQRAAEARVDLLAWFDPLSGLPNRQRLLLELGQMLQHRPGNGEHAGLLILNVDRFKSINDALGRAQGDAVLLGVAERLRPLQASGALLAHLNADEFALLYGHLGRDGATASATLLRQASALHSLMELPLPVSEAGLRLSLSIGLTLLEGIDPEQASEALRRADTALHQAKQAGGKQTVFFDSIMGQRAAERFALEQELRRGIEAGELRLYLQPQVDAQGQMAAAEALVRWAHPTRGLVSPALFIPLAEESGLIEPLGQWVLEQVCGWLGRLHALGRRMPLSVNISPKQFHLPDFNAQLLQLLQRSGAQAGDLMLEFTESVVLDEVDWVISRMAELSQHGLRFSIDDFGTGYSSLSYLKNLPIHELKIDRSFVQDAPHSPGDAALVAAMLSVAGLLKLRVVAEGVESPEQALVFQQHPGALLQGYLYGRPEPAEALLSRWLASNNADGQGA